MLKDANFGELYVGSHKADSIDHLFVSIQTFNSQELAAKTAADFYDYIVVDEFHHAAAPTYQKLLEYYQPKILLGLTATPERMDGKSVLNYFGGRIAARSVCRKRSTGNCSVPSNISVSPTPQI